MNRICTLGLSLVPALAVTAAITCCVSVAIAQTPPPPAAHSAPKAPKPAAPKPAAAPAAPAPSAPAPSATAVSAPAKPGSGEDAIARVGTTNVSADEVRAYVATLAPRDQAAVTKDPALLGQAVRLMLTNRLVLQEAQAKKFEQQPGVSAQLEQIRDNAVIELYLQSVTVPPSDFPSEDEVQRAYEGAKSQLLVPRQFQLSQIFVAVPKDADTATEEKAKQHVDEIVSVLKLPGADFAAIAAAESKDGGATGWVTEAQIREEIRPQITGLAKDEVSEPVRSDDGWHILKLHDAKPAYTRTLAEVHDQLVQQMRAERAGMLRRAYLADLQRQHPPVLNELALSTMYDDAKK